MGDRFNEDCMRVEALERTIKGHIADRAAALRQGESVGKVV